MRVVECTGNCSHQPRRSPIPFRIPQFALCTCLGQRPSLNELHREVMLVAELPNFVDMDDAGMIETGGRFSFSLKAGDFLWAGETAGMNHLERHNPVQAELASAINFTHAAVTDQLVEFVVAELLTAL